MRMQTTAAAESTDTTTRTREQEAISAPKTKWYLSIDSKYSELIKCLGSLSEMSGNLTDSINSAYTGAFPDGNAPHPTLSLVLSTVDNYLYRKHQKRKVAVSSIAALSDIISSACNDYVEAISKSAEDLAGAPTVAKNDCLSTLTPDVASAIALKSKFERGVREPLEESLSVYDISAAVWFYTRNSALLESPVTCIVVGLPAGFTNQLRRKDVEVDSGGRSTTDLPLRRNPSKFVAIASARAMSRPYDEVRSKAVAYFHPYVHAYVASEINRYDRLVTILESGSIALMCYDDVSGTWVDTNYQECVEFLENNASFGMTGYDENRSSTPLAVAQEMISYHAMDAIMKSTIRVAVGVDVKESAFSNNGRRMGSSEAKKMLTMFGNSGVIPRGGMTASQFLTSNSDGTYSAIPYSALSGEAPNQTRPADHSLLLKLLDSGVFTAGTAHERIITPDPFERVYCASYDPRNLDFVSINDPDAIPLVSLHAVSVKAE